MKEKVAKAVELEDLNKIYVILESGTYLIDGEIAKVDRYSHDKIAVDNVDDIRLVSNTTLKSHYENGDGNRMTINDYIEKKKVLTQNAVDDDEDCGYYFPSDFLDDEYEYKKFNRDWTLINKPVQEVSDPIKVQLAKTKYNTGNIHIRNLLKHDKSDDSKILCVYDRPSAYVKILNDYMESIGFSFVGDKSNYKIDSEWSNSTHSQIEYAKAFGEYLFGSRSTYSKTSNKTGTLEDCLKWYKQDKSGIEDIVHNKYMNKFGYINEGSFDFDKLLTKLKNASSSLYKVDPKVRTMQDYNNSRRQVRELIEMIENKLEVKK